MKCVQEKEDLEANLARTREKLETEVLCHNETKQRLSAAETNRPVTAVIAGDVKQVVMAPPPPPPAAPPPPMAPPGPPPPPSMNGGPPNLAQVAKNQLI